MLRRMLAVCGTVLGPSAALMQAGCGSAPAPLVSSSSAASPPSKTAPSGSTAARADLQEAPAAPKVTRRAAEDGAVYDDPAEAGDPATLVSLLPSEGLPTFPPARVGESECWKTLSLSGTAAADYAALASRCGAATGSIQYARPAVGRLHHVHDGRDTFHIALRKGLCYRFFGVADRTIPDLDILIERDGSLIGSDKTHGPVAIIDSDRSLCVDRDAKYTFRVQIDGEGQGAYIFGAWARPAL